MRLFLIFLLIISPFLIEGFRPKRRHRDDCKGIVKDPCKPPRAGIGKNVVNLKKQLVGNKVGVVRKVIGTKAQLKANSVKVVKSVGDGRKNVQDGILNPFIKRWQSRADRLHYDKRYPGPKKHYKKKLAKHLKKIKKHQKPVKKCCKYLSKDDPVKVYNKPEKVGYKQ